MVSRKIYGLVGAARGLQEKIRRVQIFEDVTTFDISKFRGFLNVDLGMTGGSVIQRFLPLRFGKIIELVLAWLGTQQKTV